MGELVLVPDTVGVGVEELVGIELDEEVPEPDGVMDGLAPRDKEDVGLAESEGDKDFEVEGVILGVCDGVAVGVTVGVAVKETGGLCDAVPDTDGVIEGEAPTDSEAVRDPDTVEDPETEEDTVGKDDGVGVCVTDGVGVVVGVCVDERELDAEALGVTEGVMVADPVGVTDSEVEGELERDWKGVNGGVSPIGRVPLEGRDIEGREVELKDGVEEGDDVAVGVESEVEELVGVLDAVCEREAVDV